MHFAFAKYFFILSFLIRSLMRRVEVMTSVQCFFSSCKSFEVYITVKPFYMNFILIILCLIVPVNRQDNLVSDYGCMQVATTVSIICNDSFVINHLQILWMSLFLPGRVTHISDKKNSPCPFQLCVGNIWMKWNIWQKKICFHK